MSAPVSTSPLRGREILLAALLLPVAVAALAGNFVQQSGARRAAAGNDAFVLEAERILSALTTVESSQRGFLITGEDRYLAPYRAARAAIPAELDRMRGAGFPLDDFPADIAGKLRTAEGGIDARRRLGLEGAAAYVRTSSGESAMELCRGAVATLDREASGRIRLAARRGLVAAVVLTTISGLAFCGALAAIGLFARRRRQESHQASSLLGAVMENAPVGFGLLDRDLTIRSMNRALAAMTVAGGTGAGRSLWEVMPGARAAVESSLRAVVAGGAQVRDIPVTPNGSAATGDRRAFEVSVFPIRARRDRGSDGAGIAVSDVTARHRSDRLLKEGEERFRTLIDASAAIIWTTDADGRLDLNTERWCRFTGQTPEAARGAGWTDAVHPDDRDGAFAAWTRAVEARQPYRTEYRLLLADGTYRIMDVHGVPILHADGTVREWVGTHTDITDRRQAEEALVAARDAADAANRAKSTFLANMSHELRTPLSAVIGYAEMLEEEVEDMGNAHLLGDLRKIESNARHLLGLINDVLDLSKIEANRMTTFAEDFDVAELLRDAANTVESLVGRNSNRLVLDLPPDLGRMHSDVVKLRQCIFNLISNAAKFTKDGEITIEARREAGDLLRFAVRDTGIGMNAEQLARLFQRFTQADEGTTRQFGGTGLGLSITRAFSRMLGGDVSVESVEGRGTTFTIRIPERLPENVIPAGGSADEDGVTADADKKLVLVIDDDGSQRELLTRFLLRDGFSVRTASDGEEGLRLAAELRPSAILLDVMMPRMDGWQVLNRLKADSALEKIPVVMASFVNEQALGRSLGAVDYLLKPVNWGELRSAMDRFRAGGGDLLVVDDDAEARARLRQALERGGWSVSEAANGQEALDAVARTVPRLILLDLTMPVMDGFEFLHALRDTPGCEQVPVVVLSARDLSRENREELSEATEILRKGDVDLRVLPHHLKDLASADASHAPATSS